MGKSDEMENTIRYAPYLEVAHSHLLNHGGADIPDMSFIDALNSALGASPYHLYDQVDPDRAFFGVDTEDPDIIYEIGMFPSLWDMFGKFMGGLDVHDLWGQIYEDVIQGPEIENVIAAQSAIIQDNIDTNVMPKFLGGMRDIGAINSSAFAVGRALIETEHVRQVNKFSTQIRMHALNSSVDMWKSHLEWDKMVVATFNDLFKSYFAVKLDIDRANLEYPAKHEMWNVNLFENARGILSAMSGAGSTAMGANEPSQLQKSVSGVLGGAAAGAMVGNVPGAIIGGIIGLAASFF